MKGIREIALGSDKEEKKQTSSLFPSSHRVHDDDDYGYDYDTGYTPRPYSSQTYDNSSKYVDKSSRTDTYTISMQIATREIGNMADDTLDEYNYDKASTKAEEIAYDRLEKLLGKNYEANYTISFEVYEGWMTWEVAVTLTPNL